MQLSEIASVSGKGSLYKVVAPTKAGVILESLDETKTKLVASASNRISLLHEISIYTTTKEGTVPLEDVLKKIKKEFGNDLGVDATSEGAELKAFMKSVLPEFDESRVYASDLKKLVKWYSVLLKFAPEIFEENLPAGKAGKDEGKKEEEKKA